ncbi:hypothetical protein [Nocardioides bigeumensis]
MPFHSRIHVELRDLTRRLILEYRGALPPGQVMVAVQDANRILGRSVVPERRVPACEGIARRVLSERVAAIAVEQALQRTA